MRCNLYANGELVGWAELVNADPPMGCASGPFYPNDNYKNIQPNIRERHLYDGTLGETNQQKLREAQAKIEAMRLSVTTEDGEILSPVGGVHIVDLSEELDERPYQLDILGLPHDVFARLFPTAAQGYFGDSLTKDKN